jgi:hypothetical protein
MYYESVTTQWSSEPKNGSVYGTRKSVYIQNGKGQAIKESLNKHGKVMKRIAHTLKHKQIQHIQNGTFLPGLWSRGKTRSMRNSLSMKPSQQIK